MRKNYHKNYILSIENTVIFFAAGVLESLPYVWKIETSSYEKSAAVADEKCP